MKLNKNLVSGALAFGLILGLAACAETVTPDKTPQQVWIESHPTTVNSDGECIEFDGEPCDDDPYDLDDWSEKYHGTPVSRRPTPRPMQTAFQPKPSTQAPVKTVAPVKTPGPVKTTKRR